MLVRHQNKRLDRPPDVAVHLVGKNADDGVRLDHAGVFAAQIELLLQRVLAREVLFGQRFVDDHDKGSARAILIVDHAAAQDRCAHGAGVVSTDGGDASFRLIRRILRPPEDAKACSYVHPGEGRNCDERCTLHAGNLADAVENGLIGERGDGRRCVPGVLRNRHPGEAGRIRRHGLESC